MRKETSVQGTIQRSDRFHRPAADAVHMRGLLGERFAASRANRLLPHEDDFLAWPFEEHCPVGINHPDRPHPELTKGDWQGEFMGTWIDSAVLTAWNADDPSLRTKVDRLVARWTAAQEPDGYLGTYDEKDRWESWDVWVQAHDILGLLSYAARSGSATALAAARRVADRVLADFGPGKRLLHTGPHGGMASSAILEPMIWLYWQTGDDLYLDFGRWIVDENWEAEGGPAISRSLLAGRGVAQTGNAKAAEMLICFTGLVELYRATGDEKYLAPVLIGWQDIVEHHLYITGSASTGEYFQTNYALRNDGFLMLGETCVSMTWLYLNLSLGRLTGEAKYFDMVEQTLYNHLLGAQSADGRGWAYYLGLRDSKRYRWHTDPDCCPSRGTRALAQMPTHVVSLTDDGVAMNFYEAMQAELEIPGTGIVRLTQAGGYPFAGAIELQVDPETPSRFVLQLRRPGWCKSSQVWVNDQIVEPEAADSGYLRLDREWRAADRVRIEFAMPARVVADRDGNMGQVAFVRGPLVFAADSADLPPRRLLDDVIVSLDPVTPAKGVGVETSPDGGPVKLAVSLASVKPQLGDGFWSVRERYDDVAGPGEIKMNGSLRLVPFFLAGNREESSFRHEIASPREAVTDATFQVWLPYLSQAE
jgi:DUF1680 family protein